LEGAGTCWLKLGEEVYSWNKANLTINNIILGTYWLDWHGNITITNHTTGDSSRRFGTACSEESFSSATDHRVLQSI